MADAVLLAQSVGVDGDAGRRDDEEAAEMHQLAAAHILDLACEPAASSLRSPSTDNTRVLP